VQGLEPVFPQKRGGRRQRGARLVQPQLQAVHQVLVAERAAFLGEQGAGLQPVEQAVQHLGVARRQRRQQGGVGARAGAEGVVAQALRAQGVQVVLQGLELVGGEFGGHGARA